MYSSLCAQHRDPLTHLFFYSFLLQLFIKHIFPQAQGYRVNSAQFSQKSRQDQNSVLKNECHVPETHRGSCLKNMLMD